MLTKFILEIVVVFMTVINLKNVVTLLIVYNTFLNDAVIIIMKTQDHSEDKDMKLLLNDEFTMFKKVITDNEFKQ